MRADDEGITAYPSQRAIFRKFIPWSDVLSCEIETYHDTFGVPFHIRPILKGAGGATLMQIHLAETNMADQDRLVKYIKARLPKPEIDPWE